MASDNAKLNKLSIEGKPIDENLIPSNDTHGIIITKRISMKLILEI